MEKDSGAVAPDNNSRGKGPQKNVADRLGIVTLYDRDGILDDYALFFLRELKENLKRLVVVCNSPLQDDDRRKLEDLGAQVCTRPNLGFDCGAYKYALLDTLGWDEVLAHDELLLANDTVYGPLYPFRKVFAAMENREADFWGLSRHPESTLLSHMQDGAITPAHIHSYFLVIRKPMLASPDFRAFWEDLEPDAFTFTEAIINWELAFSERFFRAGFKAAAYTDYSAYHSANPADNLNIVAEDALGLAEHHEHPVLKRKGLARDIAVAMKARAGEGANAFMDKLEAGGFYPVDLIWNNLLRTSNILAVKDTLHCNYVLSACRAEKRAAGRTGKTARAAALICVKDPDFAPEMEEALAALPPDLDIIRAKEDCGPLCPDLWADCLARYDFLCLLGSRQSPELHSRGCLTGAPDKPGDQDSRGKPCGHSAGDIPRRAVISALRLDFNSLLASRVYVENVLELFLATPRLGLLTAPQAYHSRYFAELSPDPPGSVEAVRELAQRLKLRVPVNPTYGRIPAASAFWCRTEALKGLLDAPPAKVAPEVLSRILPYAAQSRGYFSGTVMSENEAATRIVDLEHMLSGLLFAMNEAPGNAAFFDFSEELKIRHRLLPFCKAYNEVYIVWADSEAPRWGAILKDRGLAFAGYVVMDEKSAPSPDGAAVFCLKDLEDKKQSCGLILGLNYKNKGLLQPLLRDKGFANLLELG
ncbi:rhamnan synthesis F family protein [Desulfovibrio sp. OttesenSCG-928-G11]|nr:rhamnan synthesis F family protein [Desulfovibrio sp. OttesenSCG-928-G11]